jgi:hypothetical protein
LLRCGRSAMQHLASLSLFVALRQRISVVRRVTLTSKRNGIWHMAARLLSPQTHFQLAINISEK